MLDTGSGFSYLNKSLIEKLQIQVRNIDGPMIRLFNGEIEKLFEYCEPLIIYNDIEWKQKFYIY